jgi:hypothetical protein
MLRIKGVTFHAPENVGECEGMNPTLPSELPSELSLWELKSQWTLDFLKGDCRGQNSLIEKFIIPLKSS